MYNHIQLYDLLLRDIYLHIYVEIYIYREIIRKSKGMIHSKFRLVFACAGWEQVGKARKGWES